MGWTRENPNQSNRLQRGRACEGAEIQRTPCGEGRANICFNGAAPVRARKCARMLCAGVRVTRLQRGRACEGAEMKNARRKAAAIAMLQRGRACEGAEIEEYFRGKAVLPTASTGPRL